MAIVEAVRPDEALAREAARGDRGAFELLVRRHAGPLLAFCRGIVRDGSEAEDRVQEAFVKAYRALSRFDPARPFASWLYKIAQNVCRDALRGRKEASLPPGHPAPRPPLAGDALGRLDDALEVLPAKHRMVLHYKYRLGMNAAEIAAQLGLSHEDVRVTLHRAIRTLRERMSP
jgi:RNA polymerase sigma-70 factor (ECF subfamily)